MDQPQESRTERATLPLTPSEKFALKFMAGRRKVAESDLLRDKLISEIVVEYEDLMARLEQVEPANESDPAEPATADRGAA